MALTGRMGRVLEIGTGCGYQAAVLQLLSPPRCTASSGCSGLHDKARDNLRHLRLPNLHLLYSVMAWWATPRAAPYAGIISAAGGDALPQAWIDQLAVGGRLVAPVVQWPAGQALLVVDKTPQGRAPEHSGGGALCAPKIGRCLKGKFNMVGSRSFWVGALGTAVLVVGRMWFQADHPCAGRRPLQPGASAKREHRPAHPTRQAASGL